MAEARPPSAGAERRGAAAARPEWDGPVAASPVGACGGILHDPAPAGVPFEREAPR